MPRNDGARPPESAPRTATAVVAIDFEQDASLE